jgi:hypothetical protein
MNTHDLISWVLGAIMGTPILLLTAFVLKVVFTKPSAHRKLDMIVD